MGLLCVILFLNTLADSKDMPIGVANVHLAHVPWHVGRRPGHFESLREAMMVDGVDVINPDRHPHALVGAIVAFTTERHLEGALATPPLTVFTQEDFAFTGADSTEVRGIAPVPCFLPSKLLEPLKALFDVGD